MAWFNISLLVTLSVCVLVWCDDEGVKLEFHPPGVAPGVYKQDDTIKMVCTVDSDEKFVLDILKIVKMIDDQEYDISTNDYMVENFMSTGRYSMAWSDSPKEASATIKNAKGEDSGTIGCKHILLDGQIFSAFKKFTVVVPPKSVHLKHYTNGREHLINNDMITVREGEDGGIECEVFMDGSHDSPQTSITLDGEDAMHKFTKEENKTKNANKGLVQMKTTITYEYLFTEPDLNLNGKRLTCTSVVDGFEPLTATAMIHVHYTPRIECASVGSEPGQKAVVRCSSHMNPHLELASVSWKRKNGKDGKQQSYTLTQTEPDLPENTHHFNVTDQGDGKYIFELTIDEVQEYDFGNFKFEVENSHDIAEFKVKLVKVDKTTTTTTTTTTKPVIVDVTDPKAGAVGSGMSKTASLLVLALSTLLAFYRS